jgi:hypothetical protein
MVCEHVPLLQQLHLLIVPKLGSRIVVIKVDPVVMKVTIASLRLLRGIEKRPYPNVGMIMNCLIFIVLEST